MTDKRTQRRSTFGDFQSTDADVDMDGYNTNNPQKQTMPHPEISYGLTENPYNKQTVAFRAPENNCGEREKRKEKYKARQFGEG